MKRSFIFMILFCFGLQALAEKNESHDFGVSDGEIKELTPQQISNRLHIRGEILVLNKEGTRILNFGQEHRVWEMNGQLQEPLVSYWSFQQKGLPRIALRHEWRVLSSGQLELKVQQFDQMDRSSGSGIKTGKLLKEDVQVIKNFAAYDFEVTTQSPQKVLVRMTPLLWPDLPTWKVGDLPFAAKDAVVYDSQGNVWSLGVEGDRPSKFFGMTTHRGTLMLSFHPFKDAEVLGEAKGQRIKLKLPKLRVFLASKAHFVPGDIKADVYGKFLPNLKTEKMTSVRTFTSNKEDEFLKAVRN